MIIYENWKIHYNLKVVPISSLLQILTISHNSLKYLIETSAKSSYTYLTISISLVTLLVDKCYLTNSPLKMTVE